MGGCRRRGRGDVPECGRSGSRAGGGGHCPIRGVPSRCPPQPGAMAVVLGSSAGRGRGQRGSSEKVWGGFPYLGGGGHPLLGVPAATISQAGVQLRGGCCNPSPAPGVPPPLGGGCVQAGGRRALRGGAPVRAPQPFKAPVPGESGAVPAGGGGGEAGGRARWGDFGGAGGTRREGAQPRQAKARRH